MAQQELTPESPSVLSSPRFFDDEALSTWSGADLKRAGAAGDVDGKRLWHAPRDTWPAKPDGEPIGIECVRDEEGWHLVIDGLRCATESTLSEADQMLMEFLEQKEESTDLSQSELEQLRDLRSRPRRCDLPPPIDSTKPMTGASVTRPVVIAVRLEEGALQPLEASLEIGHELRSDEMAELDARGVVYKRTQTVPLETYRVNDQTTNAVQLAYPLCVPNQSSLGVISFQSVDRWKEKQYDAIASNALDMAEYGFAVADYNRTLSIYKATRTLEAGVNFTNALTPSMRPVTNVITRMARGVGRPTLPTRQQGKAFQPVPKTSSQVVLGGSKSAPAELNDIFQKLTAYCEASILVADHVNDRLGDPVDNRAFRGLYDVASNVQGVAAANIQATSVKDSFQLSNPLQFRLRSIRQLLHTRESSKVSGLFDALLSTQVAPSTLGSIFTLTSRYHRLDDARKPLEKLEAGGGAFLKHYVRRYKQGTGANGQGLAQRIDGLSDQDQSDYLKSLDAQPHPNVRPDGKSPGRVPPYVLLCDRMSYEKLIKTNVRVILRIKIRDFNGSTAVFEVRPSKLYGSVAHAVSSGLVQQVETFEQTSTNLVDCFYKFYDGGTTRWQAGLAKISTVVGKMGSAVKFFTPNGRFKKEVLHWGNQSYYWLFAGKKFSVKDDMKLDMIDLEDRVIELRGLCRFVLPPWPPPPETDDPSELVGPIGLRTTDSNGNVTAYSDFRSKLDEEMASFDKRQAAQQTSQPQYAKAPPQTDDPLEGRAKTCFFSSTLGTLDSARLADSVQETQKNLLDEFEAIRLEFESVATANDASRINDYLKRLETLEAELKSSGILVQRERPDQLYYVDTDRTLSSQISRQMPQIVSTKSLQARFKPPDSPDPPLFFEFEADDNVGTFSSLMQAAGPEDRPAGPGAPAAAPVTRVGQAAAGLRDMASPRVAVAITAGGAFFATGAATVAATFLYNMAFIMVHATAAITTAALTTAPTATTVSAGAILTSLGYYVFKPKGTTDTSAINASALTIVGNAFLSWLKTWMLEDEMRRAIWNQAAMDVRGNPVLQTFAAASAAVREYERGLLKQRASIGLREEVVINACYNTETGQRLQMTELYMDDDTLRTSLEDAAPVHSGRWWSVPIASALTLLPPSQVSDKIFEVTQLRAVPTSRQFALVGARDAQALPSDLAARAAVLEIFQAVKRSRRDLKGEHLISTAAQTTLSLVNDATKIIMAAYGPKSGTTLVDGDDPIWSCLAGGIVARLSLRHYDLFVQAQIALNAASGQDRVAVATEFWNGPRRRMMEAFCKALENQVNDMTRLASSFNGASLKDVCYEATGSFYRVLSLASVGVAPEVALVVASSVAHSLEFSNEDARLQVKRILEDAVTDTSKFKDQTDYVQPVQAITDSILTASWASRRLAPDVVRKYKVLGTPQNLNWIIKDLAALSVEDDSKTTSYLAPYGGRLASLPSNVIDTRGLDTRVVWLGALTDACSRLAKAVSLPILPEGGFVRIVLSEFRTFQSDASFSGIARHPLALTKAPNGDVRVRLAGVAERTPSEIEPIDNLADAVERLRSLQDQDVVQQRVHLLRCLAFNSDRIVQACGLAVAAAGRSRYVQIEFPSTSRRAHLTALAVGMAMHTTETGRILTRIRLVDQEGRDLVAGMQWLLDTAQSALAMGCKVVSLGEAALALSGFGADEEQESRDAEE